MGIARGRRTNRARSVRCGLPRLRSGVTARGGAEDPPRSRLCPRGHRRRRPACGPRAPSQRCHESTARSRSMAGPVCGWSSSTDTRSRRSSSLADRGRPWNWRPSAASCAGRLPPCMPRAWCIAMSRRPTSCARPPGESCSATSAPVRNWRRSRRVPAILPERRRIWRRRFSAVRSRHRRATSTASARCCFCSRPAPTPWKVGRSPKYRAAHAEGRRVAMTSLRRRVPRPIAAAIERAIDPDPGRRFASARDFEQALRTSRFSVNLRWAAVIACTVGAVAVFWAQQQRTADPISHEQSQPARDISLPTVSPAVEARPVAEAARAPERTSLGVPLIELLPAAFQMGGTARLRALSENGQYGVCTARRSLALCNLETGEVKQLGPLPPGNQSGAVEAAVSPDGRLIAYLSDEGPSVAVRVMTVAGSGDREIFRTAQRGLMLERWDRASSGVVVQVWEPPVARYSPDLGRRRNATRYRGSRQARRVVSGLALPGDGEDTA